MSFRYVTMGEHGTIASIFIKKLSRHASLHLPSYIVPERKKENIWFPLKRMHDLLSNLIWLPLLGIFLLNFNAMIDASFLEGTEDVPGTPREGWNFNF